MDMDKSLNYYANLAHKILNIETLYSSNKNIISLLFTENNPKIDFYQIVKNRITVIDSYYSTQMNKRLYGIDQMAEAIALYSDDEIRAEAILFLKNPYKDGIVKNLFMKKYGINKDGKSFGKAISLISKYLYFLNNYSFPIYDKLALISYDILKKNHFNSEIKKINERNYFESIKHLNNITNINNFEKLDNLLWLLGKLTKGSFSILMDYDKYLELINTKEISQQLYELSQNNQKNKSILKDQIIRGYIKNNYKRSTLFTENQKTFFEFVFNLND